MSSEVSPSASFPRAILGTCLVPWNEDGTCAEALFRSTVQGLVQTLTPHLYIFGTAGEGHAVSDDQFQAITRMFVTEMRAAEAEPMVGVISLSLATVVQRIEWAQGLGVRQFQISLPAWGPLNDAELDRFFSETCGRFPESRFLHYNLARAGRMLTGTDYARLAARHPNLVAVKMGGVSLDAQVDVARAAPQLRCFFTELAYIALRDRTDCGLLCALGGCEPRLARRLHAANAATRKELEPVFRSLHAAAKSALDGRAHIDGAYDKMYLKLNYPEFPLRLLPPYASADEEQFARFRSRCREILSVPPAS